MIENQSLNAVTPIPDDFQAALALNAPASEAFARLSDAQRRDYLDGLNGAGAVDERMAMIDAIVGALGRSGSLSG